MSKKRLNINLNCTKLGSVRSALHFVPLKTEVQISTSVKLASSNQEGFTKITGVTEDFLNNFKLLHSSSQKVLFLKQTTNVSGRRLNLTSRSSDTLGLVNTQLSFFLKTYAECQLEPSKSKITKLVNNSTEWLPSLAHSSSPNTGQNSACPSALALQRSNNFLQKKFFYRPVTKIDYIKIFSKQFLLGSSWHSARVDNIRPKSLEQGSNSHSSSEKNFNLILFIFNQQETVGHSGRKANAERSRSKRANVTLSPECLDQNHVKSESQQRRAESVTLNPSVTSALRLPGRLEFFLPTKNTKAECFRKMHHNNRTYNFMQMLLAKYLELTNYEWATNFKPNVTSRPCLVDNKTNLPLLTSASSLFDRSKSNLKMLTIHDSALKPEPTKTMFLFGSYAGQSSGCHSAVTLARVYLLIQIKNNFVYLNYDNSNVYKLKNTLLNGLRPFRVRSKRANVTLSPVGAVTSKPFYSLEQRSSFNTASGLLFNKINNKSFLSYWLIPIAGLAFFTPLNFEVTQKYNELFSPAQAKSKRANAAGLIDVFIYPNYTKDKVFLNNLSMYINTKTFFSKKILTNFLFTDSYSFRAPTLKNVVFEGLSPRPEVKTERQSKSSIIGQSGYNVHPLFNNIKNNIINNICNGLLLNSFYTNPVLEGSFYYARSQSKDCPSLSPFTSFGSQAQSNICPKALALHFEQYVNFEPWLSPFKGFNLFQKQQPSKTLFLLRMEAFAMQKLGCPSAQVYARHKQGFYGNSSFRIFKSVHLTSPVKSKLFLHNNLNFVKTLNTLKILNFKLTKLNFLQETSQAGQREERVSGLRPNALRPERPIKSIKPVENYKQILNLIDLNLLTFSSRSPSGSLSLLPEVKTERQSVSSQIGQGFDDLCIARVKTEWQPSLSHSSSFHTGQSTGKNVSNKNKLVINTFYRRVDKTKSYTPKGSLSSALHKARVRPNEQGSSVTSSSFTRVSAETLSPFNFMFYKSFQILGKHTSKHDITNDLKTNVSSKPSLYRNCYAALQANVTAAGLKPEQRSVLSLDKLKLNLIKITTQPLSNGLAVRPELSRFTSFGSHTFYSNHVKREWPLELSKSKKGTNFYFNYLNQNLKNFIFLSRAYRAKSNISPLTDRLHQSDTIRARLFSKFKQSKSNLTVQFRRKQSVNTISEPNGSLNPNRVRAAIRRSIQVVFKHQKMFKPCHKKPELKSGAEQSSSSHTGQSLNEGKNNTAQVSKIITGRLCLQKKRKAKKQRLETRRQKKRTRFFPRPNWLRYRMFLTFLNQRNLWAQSSGVASSPGRPTKKNLLPEQGSGCHSTTINKQARLSSIHKNLGWRGSSKMPNISPLTLSPGLKLWEGRKDFNKSYGLEDTGALKTNNLFGNRMRTHECIRQKKFFKQSKYLVADAVWQLERCSNKILLKPSKACFNLNDVQAAIGRNIQNMLRAQSLWADLPDSRKTDETFRLSVTSSLRPRSPTNLRDLKIKANYVNFKNQKTNNPAQTEKDKDKDTIFRDFWVWTYNNLFINNYNQKIWWLLPSPNKTSRLSNKNTYGQIASLNSVPVEQAKNAFILTQIHWALNKTNNSSLTDYNKRYILWGNQKLRNQSKNNKTKFLEKQFITNWETFFLNKKINRFSRPNDALRPSKITSKLQQKTQKLNYLTTYSMVRANVTLSPLTPTNFTPNKGLSSAQVFLSKNITTFNSSWWTNLKLKPLFKTLPNFFGLEHLFYLNAAPSGSLTPSHLCRANVTAEWQPNSFFYLRSKPTFAEQKLPYGAKTLFLPRMGAFAMQKFKEHTQPKGVAQAPIRGKNNVFEGLSPRPEVKTERQSAISDTGPGSEWQSYDQYTTGNKNYSLRANFSLNQGNYKSINFKQTDAEWQLEPCLSTNWINTQSTLIISITVLLHFCAVLSLVSISQVRCFVKFHLILLSKMSNFYTALISKITNQAMDGLKGTLGLSKSAFAKSRRPWAKSNISPISSRLSDAERPKSQLEPGSSTLSQEKTNSVKQRSLLLDHSSSFHLGQSSSSSLAQIQVPMKFTQPERTRLLTYFSLNLLKKEFRTINSFKQPQSKRVNAARLKPELLHLNIAPYGTPNSVRVQASIRSSKSSHAVQYSGVTDGRRPDQKFKPSVTLGLRPVYSKTNLISLKSNFLFYSSDRPVYGNISSTKELESLLSQGSGSHSSQGSGKKKSYKIKHLQIKIKKNTRSLFKSSKKYFLKQVFNFIDLFQSFVRSISSFFEKPTEFTTSWIAFGFLVEWSSDLITIIPENVDIYVWNVFSKLIRITPSALILNNVGILGITTSFGTGSLRANVSSCPSVTSGLQNNIIFLALFNHLLQRRIFYLFDSFVETISQPDADLMRRQQKGTLFWDIWADFLVTAADYYNVNVAALSTIKAEQNNLIEKISNLSSAQTNIWPKTKPATDTAWERSLEQSKNSQTEQDSSKSLTLHHGLTNQDPEVFKNISNSLVQFLQSSNSSFAKNQTPELSRVISFGSRAGQGSGCPSALTSILTNINRWSVNQYITYQSWHSHNGSNNSNGDLFIDYHLPKSFLHLPAIKYNSILQQPIGTLVCQIYSGIFTKQISKNILLVNSRPVMLEQSSSYQKAAAYKSNKKTNQGSSGLKAQIPTNYNILLIQALAGETELKIIIDNAQRYALVNRGFAIGIKLLRDVFDAIALNTPCIFLLLDIHAIGERRPMLISDYGGANSDDNGSFKEDFFGSQRDEVHEKNQVVYQLTRHSLTHYRKPFKGDFSLCLTPDHDVLTTEGWLPINQVTTDHTVATFNCETGELEYQKPTHIHHYEYNGKLYHIRNEQIDLMTTLNHRMLVKNGRITGTSLTDYSLVPAKDIMGKRVRYLKTANWNKKDYQFVLPAITCYGNLTQPLLAVNMDAWLTFFGLWIAEGCIAKETKENRRYEVVISQKKINTIKTIKQTITNLGYSYQVSNFNIRIFNKQLYKYLEPLSVRAPHKFLPPWVWELSQKQARLLLEGMWLGDGSYTGSGNTKVYYTSSVQLADDVMRLALHAGWSGNKYLSTPKGTVNYIDGRKIRSRYDYWCVSIIRKCNHPTVNHSHHKKQQFQQENLIQYEGSVHCLSVPNQTFYVRRNNLPVWTGNSIPTNLYVSDLFLKSPTRTTSNLSLVENHNFTIKPKINYTKNQTKSSPTKTEFLFGSLTAEQKQFTENNQKKSHLQLSKSNLNFTPPSTSPFTVLLLKEEKKLKPNKTVEELPWIGLPGEQLATKQRTSYSVRAKVSMLAELSLSNLSAKLDMITDLLVIIDSVRSNKGFVVFATTDVPHILDPALRRPGRLDETIYMPTISNSAVLNFTTNYEIIRAKSNISPTNGRKSTINIGNKQPQSLWANVSSSPRVKNYALSESSSGHSAKVQVTNNKTMLTVNLKDYNTVLNFGYSTQNNFLNYALISHSNLLKRKKHFQLLYNGHRANWAQSNISPKTFSLSVTPEQGSGSLAGRSAEQSSSFYSARVFDSYSVQAAVRDLAHDNINSNLNRVQDAIPRKLSKHSLKSNKNYAQVDKPKYKAIAYYEVGKILLNYYLNNKTNSNLNTVTYSTLKSINYLTLYGLKNNIFKQLMFVFGGKISQLLGSQKIKKNSMLLSSSYPSDSSERPKSKRASQTKSNISSGQHELSSGTFKNHMAENLFNFDLSQIFETSSKFQIATEIMLAFIHKRYLYKKNLIVPKLLSFIDGNVLDEPPSPPFSSLLIPAKRFENYKRVFHDSIFGNKIGQRKTQISFMEKIQYHLQFHSIQILKNKLSMSQTLSTSNIRPATSSPSDTLSLENLVKNIPTEKDLQTPTNINWYYQNRILKRHGQYLTNQWWNGQLSEHNAETVFLSDIDWRSSFIKNKQILSAEDSTSATLSLTESLTMKNLYTLSTTKKLLFRANVTVSPRPEVKTERQSKSTQTVQLGGLDVLLDFPDTDQYYNPRRRRWLLNKGYWSFWFNFDKVYSDEIISTWILESVILTYTYLHNNVELLDFITTKFILLGYMGPNQTFKSSIDCLSLFCRANVTVSPRPEFKTERQSKSSTSHNAAGLMSLPNCIKDSVQVSAQDPNEVQSEWQPESCSGSGKKQKAENLTFASQKLSFAAKTTYSSVVKEIISVSNLKRF